MEVSRTATQCLGVKMRCWTPSMWQGGLPCLKSVTGVVPAELSSMLICKQGSCLPT